MSCARATESTTDLLAPTVTIAKRESGLNRPRPPTVGPFWPGCRSPPGMLFGRPLKPTGMRYSVLADVERTTNSPSPTCGVRVYAAHLPSFESSGDVIERQRSQSACVSGFLAICAFPAEKAVA